MLPSVIGGPGGCLGLDAIVAFITSGAGERLARQVSHCTRNLLRAKFFGENRPIFLANGSRSAD
jgi:hypothetical protein